MSADVQCPGCELTAANLTACREDIAKYRVLVEEIAAERDALKSKLAEVERERSAFHDALTKISAIRDSIVGMQWFNFSEHAYPLVAALNAAGFAGAGYEIARKNLGTLIEQRDAAEVARNSALSDLAQVKARLEGVEKQLAFIADKSVAFSKEIEG